ncbi:MAG: histidine kinase dimerization/phosphoacceptor domain -containing protein [Patescibacteria group bacterium]
MNTRGGIDPLGDSKDGHILTRAIIDTIREPLIVLDGNLRILAASRSFYAKFNLSAETTEGKMFYDLRGGEWNIPALRDLLEKVIPEKTTVEGYQVSHNFPSIGERLMLVNARQIRYETGEKRLLLSIIDITEQRKLESEKEKLMGQKDLLLKEMSHRIANSLQLIASILMLKAKTVDSAESRAHLEDAHERIMSIATVQRQLHPTGIDEDIEVSPYLSSLCQSLARSMIGGRKPITLKVKSGPGAVISNTAVSLGLMTTELVINSLKHAFPNGREGNVLVRYDVTDSGWTLSVEDDGVGKSAENKQGTSGLGTSIIHALANQLHAVIRTESSDQGMRVSITGSVL